MSPKRYLFLFLIGLGVAVFAASFQEQPGYMDADYYMIGGIQLAKGEGFNEWVLWNYLDDPVGLPHPSHSYWMPLASILAAAGIMVIPAKSFWGARLLLLLLAGLIPPFTAALANGLYTERPLSFRRKASMLAGGLALFPGFYLPFLTTTDTFAIVMVLGIFFFWIMIQLESSSPKLLKGRLFLWGAVAGLMHLSRADGILWLGLGILVVIGEAYHFKNSTGKLQLFKSLISPNLWLALGYLFVMGPWMTRNQVVFGTLLSPGGSRSLWLSAYDQLFAFPADQLSFGRWLAAGIGEILRSRIWASGLNLQNALAVQGEVFLAPLMLFGLWRLRFLRTIRFAGLIMAGTFILMTFVFPFAGARGGYFHSGAAFQPILWAAVPAGLEGFVDWGVRLRGWKRGTAWRAFGAGLLGFAILLTGYLFWTRSVPADTVLSDYRRAEQALVLQGAKNGDIVMVNNPPGYFYATNRPAIVIPDGDLEPTLQAAENYGARYFLLGPDQGMDEVYNRPADQNGLRFLETVDGLRLFEFTGGR